MEYQYGGLHQHDEPGGDCGLLRPGDQGCLQRLLPGHEQFQGARTQIPRWCSLHIGGIFGH
jgi:hypothetical protein